MAWLGPDALPRRNCRRSPAPEPVVFFVACAPRPRSQDIAVRSTPWWPGPPGTFLSGSGDGLVVRWQLDRPDQGEVIVDVGQAVFALHLLPERGLLLIGTEGGRLHGGPAHTPERQLLEVHRRPLRLRGTARGPDGQLRCGRKPVPVAAERDRVSAGTLRQVPLSEEKLRGLAASPMDGGWPCAMVKVRSGCWKRNT